MKKTSFILLALLLSFTTYGQSELLGKWLTQDKDGVVEIYQEGEKFYGKITKLIPEKNPDGSAIVDQNNPDKSKRNRPVLGILTILDFEWNGEELTGGKVYDPNNGKFYKGKIWLDDGELKMRGYVGPFYRTETWTKLK